MGWFWKGLAVLLGWAALMAVVGVAGDPKANAVLLIPAGLFALGAWLLWRWAARRAVSAAPSAISTDAMSAELLEFFQATNAAGRFAPVQAGRLMSTPERPLLAVTQATLLELVTMRSTTHVGTKLNVGGMPLMLGRSVPVSRQEVREASTGELGLTADRLIFSSPVRTQDFQLSRLAAVDMLADGVLLSVTGRTKPVMLRLRNPMLWAQLLRNVAALQISGDQLPPGGKLQIR